MAQGSRVVAAPPQSYTLPGFYAMAGKKNSSEE
jgi:hypothetical protein